MLTAREQTRERLLEAAEEVFSEKGYHAAAMDEIGRRAPLSKGGIYFHFPSKEDLFFAVMDNLAERLVRRVAARMAAEPDPARRLDAALVTVLESLGQRRRLARLLLLQGYSMGSAFERKRVEIFTRFAALVKDGLEAAAAAGQVPPLNATITAYIWLGAINELVIRWLLTGEPDPMQEGLPVLRALLFRGVGLQLETTLWNDAGSG